MVVRGCQDEGGRCPYIWLGGETTAFVRLAALLMIINAVWIAKVSGTMHFLGPDPERYIKKIEEYAEAGFDHIYLHQVGPDQEGFFQFWEQA
jgi:hypothetical protein